MKWSDDIKPSWWPLDVDFISPDTKDNRPTVQTLDKILHAFHDDQVENKMDLMSEEDMPNASTIESLTDWNIFQVCAVGYFIGLSVNLCLDGEVVSHFTSNSQGINILIQGDEIFALSLTQDTLPIDCNRHNPFCCSESDGDETFSCPNCLLDYHSVCADRFSDCGCVQEGKELKYRVRTAIKEKALQLT
eukprot:TCONS_00040402-protein